MASVVESMPHKYYAPTPIYVDIDDEHALRSQVWLVPGTAPTALQCHGSCARAPMHEIVEPFTLRGSQHENMRSTVASGAIALPHEEGRG